MARLAARDGGKAGPIASLRVRVARHALEFQGRVLLVIERRWFGGGRKP